MKMTIIYLPHISLSNIRRFSEMPFICTTENLSIIFTCNDRPKYGCLIIITHYSTLNTKIGTRHKSSKPKFISTFGKPAGIYEPEI